MNVGPHETFGGGGFEVIALGSVEGEVGLVMLLFPSFCKGMGRVYLRIIPILTRKTN